MNAKQNIQAFDWTGRRVFLTGHTGFKGSWLSLWLQMLGADVSGYSLAPATDPAMFDAADVARGMKSTFGNICDLETMSRELQAHRPEVVLHLAAQPLVRQSYRDPLETYNTNVIGTANLLEACRRCDSIKAVVVVTTDKCYENREWVWGYREDEAMGGHDPYSSSKGCAELVTSAYRRSFFCPEAANPRAVAVGSARAGNVIGGGDWAEDRLIPDAVRCFAKGQPLVIRSPNAIRPWQHVLEPLGGYLKLAEKLMGEDGHRYAQAWNFGPNDTDARTVDYVVTQTTQRWGNSARWQLDTNPQLHEARLLKLDISKAQAELGWQPRLNLDTTLDWVVTWYKAFYEQGPRAVRELTLKQIREFQGREA